MSIRKSRLFHVWRFLPEKIKESLYPKQIEPPKTFYHGGTLYLFYKIGRRIILVIREPPFLKENVKIKIKNVKSKNYREIINLIDEINNVNVNLVIANKGRPIVDSIHVYDLMSYDERNRISKWLTEPINLTDLYNYCSFNKSHISIEENIDLKDKISTEKLIKRGLKFVENLKPIELRYPVKTYDRKFWIFRDVVYVLDGIRGGYPSTEYPNKMQYFRMITDRVIPFQFEFEYTKSILEKESKTEKLTVGDLINTNVISRVVKEITHTINLSELMKIIKIIISKQNFIETLSTSDVLIIFYGKLVNQSLTKITSLVNLEHKQVVNYVSELIDVNKAIIHIEHEQVVNYPSESMIKDNAIIEIGHEQVINYVSQSLTKEVAEIELS